MSSPNCDKIPTNAGATTRIRHIKAVMRENLGMLLMGFVFIGFALFFVIKLVLMSVNAVQDYYEFTTKKETGATVSYAEGDDEVYEEDIRDAGGVKDETDNEYAKIRSKMKEIEATYAAYNKEMGNFARNKLNRNPDDLMDRRILSRENDNFDYNL